MADWTLYRTFLAVLRTGGQSQAARELNLTQPTVRRHVEALETALGRTLFVRSSSGLAPNDLALSLRSSAEGMEAQAAAIERRASATDALGGVVRISVSRIVASEVLPPILRDLRAEEDGLRFEIDDSNAARDLLQREVDVAVRMVRPAQLDLVQKHVGQIALGLFAARSWLDRYGEPESLEALRASGFLLGFDRDPTQEQLWAEHVPGLDARSFALRCDDELTVLSAMRAGMGVGVCQLPIAGRSNDLVRVVLKWEGTLGMWVVVHRDLRREPRFARVFEHLCDRLATYAEP